LIGKGESTLNDRKKTSLQLKECLDFIDNVKHDYEYSFALVGQLDKQYNMDLTHELELSPAKDKNKIATKMRTNRLDRRYYKDIVEEFESIYQVITDEKYKKSIEMLRQALGKVRKAEEYHKDRTYYPRITKKNEIKKKVIA
jgi:hypothetical protein